MDHFHQKQLAIVIPTKQYQASSFNTENAKSEFFIRENGLQHWFGEHFGQLNKVVSSNNRSTLRSSFKCTNHFLELL
jgi:hypothetical protein